MLLLLLLLVSNRNCLSPVWPFHLRCPPKHIQFVCEHIIAETSSRQSEPRRGMRKLLRLRAQFEWVCLCCLCRVEWPSSAGPETTKHKEHDADQENHFGESDNDAWASHPVLGRGRGVVVDDNVEVVSKHHMMHVVDDVDAIAMPHWNYIILICCDSRWMDNKYLYSIFI